MITKYMQFIKIIDSMQLYSKGLRKLKVLLFQEELMEYMQNILEDKVRPRVHKLFHDPPKYDLV